MLIAARLWDDTDDEALLGELAELLNACRTGKSYSVKRVSCSDLSTCGAASGFAPLYLLRPTLFHLSPTRLNHLHARLLQILRPEFIDDHSLNIAIHPWSGRLSPDMRSEFRNSLSNHLFGWDVLLSLRMRLSLADLAWVCFLCGMYSADLSFDVCETEIVC